MLAMILSGVLDQNNQLRLEIPFVSDVPAAGAGPLSDDAVVADLLDSQNNVIGHGLLDASPICAIPAGAITAPPLVRLVSGAVPMPDGTTGLRLTWRNQIVHESHMPQGQPTIGITWQPPTGIASGQQTVTWQASHPDAAPMHFLVFLQRLDGSRQPIASVTAQQADLDFDLLPPDRGARIVVVASDGFHLASDQTSPFFIGRG